MPKPPLPGKIYAEFEKTKQVHAVDIYCFAQQDVLESIFTFGPCPLQHNFAKIKAMDAVSEQ